MRAVNAALICFVVLSRSVGADVIELELEGKQDGYLLGARNSGETPRSEGVLDLLWAKGPLIGSVASAGILTGQVWRSDGIAHVCRLDT